MKTRKVLLVSIVCILLSLSGCGDTSAQRIDALQSAFVTVTETSELLGDRIEEMNTIITAATVVLSDPNAPLTEEFAQKLVKAQAELAKVLPMKVKADNMLKDITARLDAIKNQDTIGVEDELNFVSGVLTAAGGAVGGQAGIYIKLLALLLSTGAGIGIGFKKERIATTQIVKGIDKAIAAGAIDMAIAGPILSDQQSLTTRAIVDKIQVQSPVIKPEATAPAS